MFALFGYGVGGFLVDTVSVNLIRGP